MFEHTYIFPILLFSVVIHEIAHGYMALRLGDPTAKEMGRLTLNPVPHIDLIGSILVPVLSLLLAGRVFIAWAKPVPINPFNFRNFKRDDILVSVIGPASNIFLSFSFTIITIILILLQPLVISLNSEIILEVWTFFSKMFYAGIFLNIILAVFNMIPIPPLDGSHILASLLPESIGEQFRSIGFFGVFVVILLMRVDSFRNFFFGVIETIATPFIFLINILT